MGLDATRPLDGELNPRARGGPRRAVRGAGGFSGAWRRGWPSGLSLRRGRADREASSSRARPWGPRGWSWRGEMGTRGARPTDGERSAGGTWAKPKVELSSRQVLERRMRPKKGVGWDDFRERITWCRRFYVTVSSQINTLVAKSQKSVFGSLQ
jgi:hypothetical protein